MALLQNITSGVRPRRGLPAHAITTHTQRPGDRSRASLILPLIIAGLIIAPLALLTLELLTPDIALWEHLWATILPPMLRNTATLAIGTGLSTLVIGAGFAWLVTAHEFPGRAIFDRALLLPLAIPSFVMGFVFMATFDFAGPVQTAWRSIFGRDAWFPDLSSAGGVILVMTLVLYPYVYLLARAAFREQAASTFEAARVMGYSRLQAFFRLVLPLALSLIHI
ncbi:MAG: iron ABC transporter permease, partial [Chloroflexi bacterium]|nr:iron ABC transporter permease [Chloroflexota bacterium]